MTTGAFDSALVADECYLELDDGEREHWQVRRWRGEPDVTDSLMLDRCCGPTLDIGCGPGRMTRAILARGNPSIGVDTSAVAVRMTAERGGLALRRSVFHRLPGEGNWRHALLADGNVGIGGDPARLLIRVRELLTQGGSAIVELGAPGTGVRCGHGNIGGGPWFRWARVGMDAIDALAETAGFRTGWTAHQNKRWFAELIRIERVRAWAEWPDTGR